MGMANRDILAVGTSAGGVEALIHVAKGLPPNLPASVLLTIHLPSHARSALDDVLTRAGPLPASFAARKLYTQAMAGHHPLLAENWAQKIKEFEREADIIRNSTRRMDRIAAQAEMARESGAE